MEKASTQAPKEAAEPITEEVQEAETVENTEVKEAQPEAENKPAEDTENQE